VSERASERESQCVNVWMKKYMNEMMKE
jgi:hypothetical protein